MSLVAVEQWTGRISAVTAIVCLIVLLAGIARGLRRSPGRATGQASRVLRLPVYFLISVLFFGLCYLLWRPLPLDLSVSARTIALVVGGLIYFPGLALVLWARATLGGMYNVSSSLGAQLYIDHRLVTHGPFAVVRHPMYVGILLASAGGLFVYRTWTMVFVLVAFLGLVLRARREEQALAAEFGDEWETYYQRVQGWIPRVPRRR